MASEIQVTTGLRVLKGNFALQFARNFNADLTGTVSTGGTPLIPTTAGGTALNMGSVTTAGWGYFVNTDDTNYVEIGTQVTGTFVPFAKLLPGEAFPIRLGTNAPYALANTGAVELQYLILQA